MIMKKIFLYALTIVALLATSCKDMLEEKPYGKPTAEEMLSEPDNVAKVVGQAYADLKWLHDHWGYWGITTISTDECINPKRGTDWDDNGYWVGLNDHSWTPNDLSFEYLWQFSNAGAVLCNKILNQLNSIQKDLPVEIYSRFTAELKVLRAYYYYTLFDAFGRIPYLEDYTAENVPQSDPWVVWNKLVTTLEAEALNLPVIDSDNKVENYGRCSQGMAYTLLARLYLNAASYGVTPANCGIKGITSETDFYNKCVETCQKVIDSKSYVIEDEFLANFKVNNENSNENIFVIVEDGNASIDYRDHAGKMANKLRIVFASLNYCHQEAYDLIEKPWNGFCCPPDFLSLYEYGKDLRGPCDSTLGTKDTINYGWFIGPIYHPTVKDSILRMDGDHGNLEAIIVTQVSSVSNANHNEGARLLKYEVAKSGVNKYCDNDFVLLRYADVLYMQYEAALRAGNVKKTSELLADGEFQKIRTRAGMPAYTSLDLDELLDERGREFAWEIVRRRDLIRYNKYSQGTWLFKEKGDKSRDWFPIPRKMIETSGGLWTQNEGYITDK